MIGNLLEKLMNVDTIDAIAGLGYLSVSAVTLLPDTTATVMGTALGSVALPISLGAVAIAYLSNQPSFDFDDTEEQLMAAGAGASVLVPVGLETGSAVSSAASDPLIGGLLFGVSTLGYGIVAGLNNN